MENHEPVQATKTTKKKVTPKRMGRVFAENKQIYHDLYKLLVATMKKNMSWHPIPPEEYTGIEHCHFFHTFDSSGRKQTFSTPVGGHFHELEVIEQKDGEPPKVICKSGPLKYKWVKKFGKRKKELVPVNEVDTHMHDVMYLQSNEINVRKMNEEAAKVIGANASLVQKPSGLDIG